MWISCNLRNNSLYAKNHRFITAWQPKPQNRRCVKQATGRDSRGRAGRFVRCAALRSLTPRLECGQLEKEKSSSKMLKLQDLEGGRDQNKR